MEKCKRPSFLMGLLLCLVVLSATFPYCFAAAFSKPNPKKFGSSFVFPVDGNVYPKGYYHVSLFIGHPPKLYFLDIDTGSDLTWLQCDAPCVKCTPAPHSLYKPNKNLISCQNPLCASVNGPGNHHCEDQDQCDYEIVYADQGSSIGVLVEDTFPLKFTNGTVVSPRLAFGCGYNQEIPDPNNAPYTDGVLGLSGDKSSIPRQLRNIGLSRNVVGHCLSAQGGGFLFVGDDLLPSTGVSWAPLLRKPTDDFREHLSLGPADILFGELKTGVNGVPVIFDSGSTYSYFSIQAYDVLLDLIKEDLKEKQLKEAKGDGSLPVCWKGPKPYKSAVEAKSYFKPITMSFRKANNVQLHIYPEAYLIATKHGNICLGILNGSEVGLEHVNVIGDISMQDKMVIYDYENQRIGWFEANCDKLYSVDGNHNVCFHQPHSADIAFPTEQWCPADILLEK
ncbi:hypothetical protein Leryth_003164 [Lithospermum erythrorhizon]|nr:hypothetical protein Leryth_003164 [Lithospermum erythrorhizon]